MLVSAIGTRPGSIDGNEGTRSADTFGTILESEMESSRMRIDGLIRREDEKASTAVCNLILGNDGGLIAGIADMDIAESIEPEEVGDIIACPVYTRGCLYLRLL